MAKKVVTSDYAQMLLNGVDNFTATYFAEVIGTCISRYCRSCY